MVRAVSLILSPYFHIPFFLFHIYVLNIKSVIKMDCEISNMFEVKDYNSVLDLSGRQRFVDLQFTTLVPIKIVGLSGVNPNCNVIFNCKVNTFAWFQ